MTPTVALGIPHASWLPERAAMMAELREGLRISKDVRGFAGTNRPPPSAYMEFSDREHWSLWFPKMLRWALTTDASHFVTLQDDVEVAPSFWPSLTAMLTAWPSDFVSLAATHSLGPEVARQGRRSYLTSKVVGWGWACPMPLVRSLLAWMDAGALAEWRKEYPNDGEDSMAARFLAREVYVSGQARTARCPVPTIVDHRFCKSTNEGFDDHTHRKSTVTWRGFAAEDMATPDWWRTTAAELPPDDWRRCWYCGERPGAQRSGATGAEICGVCITAFVGSKFGLTMRV